MEVRVEILEEGEKLSRDFLHNPELWIHRRCTNIDGYGKLDYFRVIDVCDFVDRMKTIFCRCTNKVECFYCYKFRIHSGQAFIDKIEEMKEEATHLLSEKKE